MSVPRPQTFATDTKPGELATRLNEFVRDVLRALTARPAIEARQFTAIGGAYGMSVSVDARNRPTGVWVLDCKEARAPQVTITNAVAIDWEWKGRAIKVRNLTGLTAGTEYLVTIAVME